MKYTTSRRRASSVAALGLFLSASLAGGSPVRATGTESAAVPTSPTLAVADSIPMAFEPNVGQTDARVRFLARGRGYTAFFGDRDVTLSLVDGRPAAEAPREGDRPTDLGDPSRAGRNGEALRMTLVGARQGAAVRPERELPG